MTTGTTPPTEETNGLQIPNDIYVGLNVVRKHITEFFHRASTQGLLSTGESVLAIFDCMLLEPDGRRLGNLTLHDYAILTEQHLIIWGRGLNRDIIDKIEWGNVGLDKFGRRTPLEGVVKVAYNLKSTNIKRRISFKGGEAGSSPAEIIEPEHLPTQFIYLDLMPIEDVRVCAGMIRFLIKANSEGTGSNIFKEHFRADITRSQKRLAQINSLIQFFYVDMGNGVLVEADTVKDLHSEKTSSSRVPVSPYRGVGSPYIRHTPRGQSSAGEIPKDKKPVAQDKKPANASESKPKVASKLDAIQFGPTSSRGGGAVAPKAAPKLEVATPAAKATPKLEAAKPAQKPEAAKPAPKPEAVKAPVKPSSGIVDRPSKLDAYENRVSGRSDSSTPTTTPAPESRPTPSASTSWPKIDSSVKEPVKPSSRLVAARAERTSIAPRTVETRPEPAPKTQAVRETRHALATRPVEEVVTASAPTGTRLIDISLPIVLGRELLNPYSISRLVRGLWFDPNSVVNSANTITQTAGAIVDIADVVTTDEEARTIAVNRVRSTAYSIFRNNPLLRNTIWPFMKPVLDLILLPEEEEVQRNRLQIRTIDQKDKKWEGTSDTSTVSATTLKAPAKPAPVAVTPPAPAKPTPAAAVTPPAPAKPAPAAVTPPAPKPVATPPAVNETPTLVKPAPAPVASTPAKPAPSASNPPVVNETPTLVKPAPAPVASTPPAPAKPAPAASNPPVVNETPTLVKPVVAPSASNPPAPKPVATPPPANETPTLVKPVVAPSANTPLAPSANTPPAPKPASAPAASTPSAASVSPTPAAAPAPTTPSPANASSTSATSSSAAPAKPAVPPPGVPTPAKPAPAASAPTPAANASPASKPVSTPAPTAGTPPTPKPASSPAPASKPEQSSSSGGKPGGGSGSGTPTSSDKSGGGGSGKNKKRSGPNRK